MFSLSSLSSPSHLLSLFSVNIHTHGNEQFALYVVSLARRGVCRVLLVHSNRLLGCRFTCATSCLLRIEKGEEKRDWGERHTCCNAHIILGQISIDPAKELESSPSCTFWFSNTVFVGQYSKGHLKNNVLRDVWNEMWCGIMVSKFKYTWEQSKTQQRNSKAKEDTDSPLIASNFMSKKASNYQINK